MGGRCGSHEVAEKCIQILVRKPKGNRQLIRTKCKWEDSILN
jgi:hypothetical protein